MINEKDEWLYRELSGNGRERAFRILYDRYSSPLFRFIHRFTLNNQFSEDILHDIFAEVLAQKFVVSSESNFKAWIYTLAKNKSLNHLRKKSFEVEDESILENACSTDDIEDSLTNEKLLKKLSEFENALPSDLFKPWQLRKQGMDYFQISQTLSIPVGTVKSRFYRLVEHLKKEFQK